MKNSFTFFTLLLYLTAPFSEAQSPIDYSNFNNVNLNGWILENGTQTNQWRAGNAESYYDLLSRSGIYISSDLGTNYNYINNTSSVVHMYKDIAINTVSNDILLTFKLKCGGEYENDYLSIHAIPSTITPVAGVELNTGNIGKSEYGGSDYWRGYSVKINRADFTDNFFRLVFSWRNDDNGIGSTPAAVDEIRLSQLNLDYNSWTPRQNLPSARYYSGSFTSGYSAFIGGGDFTGGGVGTDAFLEFDFIGNSVKNLPLLPEEVRLNELTKFDGKIFSIGGFNNGSTSPNNKVFSMDLGDFSWTPELSFPKQIFYHRLAVHDWKTMYSVGGSDETNTLLNSVYYRLKGSTDWNEATPIPGDGRADGGMEILNRSNKMIYIGGFTNAFDFPVQIDSVFIGQIDTANPGNITWTTGSNFPGGPRARLRVFEWGRDKVIVVGGTNGDNFSTSTIFDDVWTYDLNEDNWEKLNDIPNAVCAYMGGSSRLTGSLHVLFISGGIRTGPALSNFQTVMYDSSQSTTSIDEIENTLPSSFLLEQNYPNPFNPNTVIRYQLPVSGNVTLKVYDILGNYIATLVDKYKPPGNYEVKFHSSDSNYHLTSGIYFYRLMSGAYTDVKKMILIK